MPDPATDRTLLVTVPSFACDGVPSADPAAGNRIEVVLPAGTFVKGADVSLCRFSIDADGFDPFTPLPFTHCLYLPADREITLSGAQGKEVVCSAYELRTGIERACIAAPTAGRRKRAARQAVAHRKGTGGIASLETRAETAIEASRSGAKARKGR